MKRSINLDTLFKSKLKSGQHDMLETDWAAMEKILDQDEKKRRFFIPFGWIISGTAAALLSGFVLFRADQSSTAHETKTIQVVEAPSTVKSLENNTNQSPKAIAEVYTLSNRTESPSKSIPFKSIHKKAYSPLNQVSTPEKSIENDFVSAENELPTHAPNSRIESADLAPIPSITSQLSSTGLSPVSIRKIQANQADPFFEPHLSLGLGLDAFTGTTGFGAWGGGLLASYAITEDLNLETGFRYHKQQNAHLYSKLRQDESFGFGSQIVTYGMYGDDISFLSIPLGISKKWNKMKYGAGFHLDFLLGVQGEVQEIALMPSSERSKVREVVKSLSSGWLDTSGFRQTNGRVYLQAHRELLPQLYLGARIEYRPLDLLKNGPELLEKQSTNPLFIGLGLQMFMP